MKLEVGQKIGIYEALINIMDNDSKLSFLIKRGNFYCGILKDRYLEMVDEENHSDYCIHIHKNDMDQEVRKVGSLIVKRLK